MKFSRDNLLKKLDSSIGRNLRIPPLGSRLKPDSSHLAEVSYLGAEQTPSSREGYVEKVRFRGGMTEIRRIMRSMLAHSLH